MEIVEKSASPVRKPTPKRPTAIRTNPSLIEFPGVNRSSLPEWRQELVERVREVQERKAREAALESGEPLFSELEAKGTPTLELLARTDAPELNPIVVAALRRIERAHAHSKGNAAVATAVAYHQQPDMELDLAPDDADGSSGPTNLKPERVHNLAVVPTPTPPSMEILETTTVATIEPAARPRRIIDDQNDPALNYLDSIPTTVIVDRREYRAAPLFRRIIGAMTDLVIVFLFSSPVLALIKLTSLEWRDPKVIGFTVLTFMVVGFLYLTVSIAFTGRTVGLKLFSLRVVDARTGLIPTGSQSAGRALVYMLSLASAGIALMYAFVDSDNYTAHDRVTRTAVIRA
jgi:uncharacterized RDD family membrane protein YckC